MMGGWGPIMMIVWILVVLVVLALALYGLLRLFQDLGGAAPEARGRDPPADVPAADRGRGAPLAVAGSSILGCGPSRTSFPKNRKL